MAPTDQPLSTGRNAHFNADFSVGFLAPETGQAQEALTNRHSWSFHIHPTHYVCKKHAWIDLTASI